MNWSHTYGAKINCKDFKVIQNDGKRREVFHMGKREETLFLNFCYDKLVSYYVKGVLGNSVLLWIFTRRKKQQKTSL